MARPFVVLVVLLLLARGAPAGTANAPHVTLEHQGIDAPYAEAIAQTLSAARQIYVDAFGFDMPDRIAARAVCGPDETTKLYTDGRDGVFLSLTSKESLAPPPKSGVFNLYGMCHELGHMAMYRTLAHGAWMTTACA